jgi:hypothetical protein
VASFPQVSPPKPSIRRRGVIKIIMCVKDKFTFGWNIEEVFGVVF